jgi:hypothetical protein
VDLENQSMSFFGQMENGAGVGMRPKDIHV